MGLLSQFLLRLAFGLAVGMAITSARQVTSGFYRNHLYVTLGLTTLAAMVLAKMKTSPIEMWLAVAAAVISYIGSAAWLYEAKRFGKLTLWLVAACSITAAVWEQLNAGTSGYSPWWSGLSVVTSGLVLGLVFASMLLGHWYLNAPGMELAPLRWLLTASAIVVTTQAVVVGAGLAAEVTTMSGVTASWLLFELLRWSFGLCGVLALLWMARRTLEIPNTQSATGILYVAVLGVFIGELTGLLLSAESVYPL
jgi:hypothetical protein